MPAFKRGWCLNEKGYRRIRAGKDRNKYEHRAVIERMLQSPLCADYVFSVRGVIPPGFVVEHIDHRRTHNCGPNLMLLQKAIHDKLTGWTIKFRYENTVWEDFPDWVVDFPEPEMASEGA